MNLETFVVISDTIIIFGAMIGFSLNYFFDRKRQNNILREQEYRDKIKREIYSEQQTNVTIGLSNKPDIKPINTKTVKELLSNDICKCGHSKTEHILNTNNKKHCLHVIKSMNNEDDIIFCECKNYNPK